jgi:hypothetical protein
MRSLDILLRVKLSFEPPRFQVLPKQKHSPCQFENENQ